MLQTDAEHPLRKLQEATCAAWAAGSSKAGAEHRSGWALNLYQQHPPASGEQFGVGDTEATVPPPLL